MRMLDSDWLIRVVAEERLLPLDEDWLVFVDSLDERCWRHTAINLRWLVVCGEKPNANVCVSSQTSLFHMFHIASQLNVDLDVKPGHSPKTVTFEVTPDL